MAGVDVFVKVEDIATKLLTYESVELHRGDTLAELALAVGVGNRELSETETLVADTYYYAINNADGTLNHWYKYRFHHDTGSVNSAYSNPFRVDGVTRLRARQEALARYGAGIVVVNTNPSNTKVTTSDYRFKTTLFRTDRGKGSWLLVTTGDQAGDMRIVSSSSPTAGDLAVLPIFGGNLANGNEVEWHTLADPTVWNDAFNRAMARYFHIDRVPLLGVANQEEYDLASLPWITDPDQIHDVTWYPTSGKDVEQSYGCDGKWWRPRMDRESIVLTIYPPVDDDELLHLYTSRPMPALYTDDSAAPPSCAEELAAALTYDEVLAWLSDNGSVEDRKARYIQRKGHGPELRRLLRKHRPKPRYGPAQLPYPPVAPSRFKAR